MEQKKKGPAGGRPFKKGQSGNPRGRPKKNESISEILAELAGLNDITLPGGEKISRKRALAERMWGKAIRDGDTTAMKFIITRLEGENPLKIQATDEDGEPIPIMGLVVVQKRSLDEWRQEYNSKQSGSPSPDKPKHSRARRSSSSLEEPKAGGKATS